MRVLWAACLVALVCSAWGYDGEDDEDAMMAAKFELDKELEEAHDPDHEYKDVNEAVVEEREHPADPLDGYQEQSDDDKPMRLPPWYHLPPWLLPGFSDMFPFLPNRPSRRPFSPPSFEEKYLRRIQDDDYPPVPYPLLPPLDDDYPPLPYPLLPAPEDRDYRPLPPPEDDDDDDYPPLARYPPLPLPEDDYPLPPFYPPLPPPEEDYEEPEHDDDDDYPEAIFPPLEYPGPQFGYPMPPYPLRRYDDDDDSEDELDQDNDDDDDSYSRKKRSILVDTMTIHDPSEWWMDIDNGRENKVTKKLARTKSGISTHYMMLDSLDHYSPALHLGEIDTGYLRNPELEMASDRTFGYDSDFYLGDMDAFRFTPHGERYDTVWQFLRDVNNGKIALGRRFTLKKLFFDNCFECYVGKDLKKVKDMQYVNDDYSVDAFTGEARNEYWFRVSCGSIRPGKYIFIAIKKDSTSDGENSSGKIVSFVMFFQDSHGNVIAVVNPNLKGMQADSPFRTATNFRTLARTDEHGNKLTKTYLAAQPDIAHIRNAEYTATGGWAGEDFNPTFHPDKHAQAPYDESEYWRTETGSFLPYDDQKYEHIKQGEINRRLVGHQYDQQFQYYD